MYKKSISLLHILSYVIIIYINFFPKEGEANIHLVIVIILNQATSLILL